MRVYTEFKQNIKETCLHHSTSISWMHACNAGCMYGYRYGHVFMLYINLSVCECATGLTSMHQGVRDNDVRDVRVVANLMCNRLMLSDYDIENTLPALMFTTLFIKYKIQIKKVEIGFYAIISSTCIR